MKHKKRTIWTIIFCLAFFPFVLWAQDRSEDTDVRLNEKDYLKVPPIEHFSVTAADIRSVIKQLSEYSGADIVINEKVAGTISLSLTHKTWKEILAIICKVQNLTVIREKSYLYLIPTEEYQKKNISDATAQQQAQTVVELKREVIKVKNVAAQDMDKAISTLLSARGKATVVEHTNSLIIYDTDENIRSIKKTIRELDVETDQICISCKIIQTSSSKVNNLGIQWGYFDKVNGINVSAQHLTGTVVSGAQESVTFGILSQDKFSFTLEYLFQDSKTEIVAQPQITTLDNKEAKIFTGSEVPVTYQDEASNTLVKMVEAGTELTVTPHITGDKRIMLNLSPKKSSYTMSSDNEPIVTTQSAQTNVVVSDGETIVIAGLTSTEKVNTDEGVPFLKDIPIIGYLFKRSSKSLDKNDLMVFVTPHIIAKKAETPDDAEPASSQPVNEKATDINK
jgi:type IV pilus assembly protein PilQ